MPLTVVYSRPCESCNRLAPVVIREAEGVRFFLCADCAADNDQQAEQ